MKGRAIPGPSDFDQIPELAERGMKRVPLFFDLLEARLKDSPWLAGARFTLADITGFVMVDSPASSSSGSAMTTRPRATGSSGSRRAPARPCENRVTGTGRAGTTAR